MVLGIVCLFFDNAASESGFYRQKQMAKKAGRDDVVGRLEQQQCVMQQASDQVHNITDKINNFIDK